MLADELIASEQLRRALGDADHNALSNALRAAQRFSLSREFAGAATQISHTNTSSFANCMVVCRAPAQLCWLEVPNSFRSDFMEDNWIANHDHISRATRVGILLESVSSDCTEYCASLAFKCENGTLAISTISTNVNLYGMRDLPDWHREAVHKFYSGMLSGAELDAALSIESRALACPCRFTSRPIARLKEIYGSGEEDLDRLFSDEKHNWDGEMKFWFSALALLNTRNVGGTVTQDMSKINKARFRSGKKPLLGYSVCTIDAAKTSTSSGRGHASKGEIRAHFMRGHFKLRKTGVFWWRPSMRGNLGAGAVTKSYSVRHTERRAA